VCDFPKGLPLRDPKVISIADPEVDLVIPVGKNLERLAIVERNMCGLLARTLSFGA
jgi:hypothetical protein